MNDIYDIYFKPKQITGQAKKGITIFDAAVALGIFLRSDCGKKGTCGKCRVIVDHPEHLSPVTATEEKVLSLSQREASHRLACQAKILGPVTVTIPDDLLIKNEVSGKTGLSGAFPINFTAGLIRENSIGFAFDIGTTTIAAYLCHFASGRIITSRAMVNPQRSFGEDVIARIAAVIDDEKNLAIQQKLAATAMNELMQSCLEATGNKKSRVAALSIVGNTTMEHIIAGLDPSGLGVAPYLPVTRSSITIHASELGLDLPAETPVYIFPVISGFLGGDILSALLADQSCHREETTLIIDIGTNGELMLCSPSGMWATSCATGPALEGAQISCGMRASSGAISKVFFDPDTENKIRFETIDQAPPTGICGSGIIDALAAMRKAGITNENGSFNPDHPGVVRDETGMGKKFIFPQSNIHITLKDVRQVQLAKAALFVGIRSLLEKAEITDIDRTILTGAFGATFNWQNARDIGMLPEEICRRTVESAQNLAGTGSVMALLDQTRRIEIETLAPRVVFLDLSCEPNFTTRFSDATRFPALR